MNEENFSQTPETENPVPESSQDQVEDISNSGSPLDNPSPPIEKVKPAPVPWSEKPGLRLGLNVLGVVLLALAALLALQRLVSKGSQTDPPAAQNSSPAQQSGGGAGGPIFSIDLAPFATPALSQTEGIIRRVNLNTDIPSRQRSTVVTYTVESGDTLFTIADKYGLKPETLLWGNFDTLKDNPNLLTTGQVLNVLPVDGVYYQWKAGDTLNGVAASFNTDPQAILNYSGNSLDLTQDISQTFGLQPGTWLIVPGGKRPLKDWGPPAISRKDPAAARYYGPGSCGSVYEGAIGTGTFVWPTTAHFISGYNYSPIHRGVDIGGAMGNAIFAADSGVVVYAGWSNFGYGNLLVIDHGNGFQTAYGHMSTIAVTCGQSVYQGGYVGAMGSTGNSTGPHLHFEVVYNGAKPNPLDYIH